MTEFWEASFRDKQEMWGFEASASAINTARLFKKLGIKKVLVPGIGYGRNARVFVENGMEVTGIEISQTAMELGTKYLGGKVRYQQGSVSDMPFDEVLYDGIFCYALIHLLNEKERTKLIRDCYDQLVEGGQMVFVAISVSSPSYGEGKELAQHYYETPQGVRLFYYDAESVNSAFANFGLYKFSEISEAHQNAGNKPTLVFWEIICRK